MPSLPTTTTYQTFLTTDRQMFEDYLNMEAACGYRLLSSGRDDAGGWWAVLRTVTTNLTFRYKVVIDRNQRGFETALNQLDAAYFRVVSSGRDPVGGGWWAVMILFPTGPYAE